MFNIFNTSGDGSMSLQEFQECYDNWVVKVISPHQTPHHHTITQLLTLDREAKVCSRYCGCPGQGRQSLRKILSHLYQL